MICPKCESEVSEDGLFCPKCGVRLGGNDNGFEGHAAAPSADNSAPESPPPATASESTAATPRDKFRPADDRQDIVDDEEVDIWKGGYSPKAMFSVWIAAGLLTLLAMVGAIWLGASGRVWLYLSIATACVWIGLLLRLVYMRLDVHYHLTSQRFIHEQGILRRKTDRVEVIDIDDVAFEQNIIERIVGVGTIRLESSDKSHSELVLKGIDQVKEVAGQLDAARRKERVRRGLHIEAV
ncbi:MAG: PH domain-containing protein [Pirellulales bacterium]